MFVEWQYRNGEGTYNIVSKPTNLNNVEFQGTQEECENYIKEQQEQYEFECYEALSSIGDMYFG